MNYAELRKQFEGLHTIPDLHLLKFDETHGTYTAHNYHVAYNVEHARHVTARFHGFTMGLQQGSQATTQRLHLQFDAMVAALVKPGQDILDSLTPQKCNALHMAVGQSGEAGELLDAIKNWVIYGKELNRENVVEEMGDIEFYLNGLRAELGITREECLQANVTKLLTGSANKKARYAEGTYSDAQAQDRADKEGAE
ncbi:MazG-like nucleotide pyrophosphohydrolase [Pseudomonas phage MiCath]|uniref:MazG-like nucleotide pyrophosphohydrolase n=1 Tax=Pseudomonas phage MiCath TaxID=3003729 RepID=A0A9Y1HTJ2_9CAUD|nr:MazG-like nucleotide pyrophosphohydrolase [Pseudomonas phage MiCath]WAX22366.1 MazG-like nucleotide pyrophosphohydrolase [Pseudomonas phage MiCath]